MTEIDLTPLQTGLAELTPPGRTSLLPALHLAQELYGYIPEPVATEIGKSLGVPLADVHGVIEFYSLFYREPVGKKILRVCTDPACQLAGGESVLEKLCQQTGLHPGETQADGS